MTDRIPATTTTDAPEPVGTITYGSGQFVDAPEDYKGGPAVIQRILPDDAPHRVRHQYRVLLPVGRMWQAQAIAAILNAEHS